MTNIKEYKFESMLSIRDMGYVLDLEQQLLASKQDYKKLQKEKDCIAECFAGCLRDSVFDKQTELKIQNMNLNEENKNMLEAFEKISKEIIIAYKQGEIDIVGYEIRNPKAIYEAIKEVDQALSKRRTNNEHIHN